MADADSTLDILIRMLSETQGADQVQAALNKTKAATGDVSKATSDLTDKTKEGTKATEKSEIGHRELHQILHLIATESGPGAGAAISAGVAAGTGSLLIAIMAARELLELFKQNAEAAKEMAAAIAAGIDSAGFIENFAAMKTAMLNATDQAQSFEEALRKIDSAQDSLSQKSETAIGLIQQELAADLAVAAAKKQALIDEIKAKEALGALTKAQAESAIADLESKSEKEANDRKQMARLQEIVQLKNAQVANRDEFPAAKAEADSADKARQTAEQNEARRKFLVDNAKEALDESKDGSIAAELKKKQAALDEIPLVAQHDWTLVGRADEASNLRMQIESLQALKDQARQQLKKYGTPEAEHSSAETERQAKAKADEAEDRAKNLETENKALAKKISDLEAADKIATNEENTTAKYHDQARAEESVQRRATDDRSTADKDVSRARKDIEEINRTAARAASEGVSPADIAAAKAAVTDLHKTLSELPRLLAELKRLGTPAADLQRQIDDLKAATGRAGY